MPTDESETVFNPATDREGVRRVPLERPTTPPKRDLTGRNPDGPKTKHFELDDIEDAEVKINRSSGPAPARPKRKDEVLQKFLDS